MANNEEPTPLAAATTVGVTVEAGVVIAAAAPEPPPSDAAERLVTPVTSTVAMAATGSQAGVDAFVGRLRRTVDTDEMEQGRPLSVAAIARRAASILANLDGPIAVVLGGVDPKSSAGRLFELDAGGGQVETNRAVIGSGNAVAAGVLEGASLPSDAASGRTLVSSAIRAAAERDPESAEVGAVATITGDGMTIIPVVEVGEADGS